MTIDELEQSGLKQYEISNFAKPGFECEHNLNYWANKPCIGIGPAAG
jgi:oxygen-independent coproporphyrinogen-3 oxidase